ncbi:MAG: hypothetical protein QM777_02815 [Pseudorhodoferax sp.]
MVFDTDLSNPCLREVFDVHSVFNHRVHDHTVGANGLESSLAGAWVESA